MKYLLAFALFIVLNTVIYNEFEISGFLIYNFAVISLSLVMIYDKIGKKSSDILSSKSYITEQNKLKQQLSDIDKEHSR
ncbi:MAG: hypothetical protein NAG76_18275 [Candidatus Pristimantibacillus lignocellulolyticus]|uniref:Uncharacterized protein n=1 Tax=Candidatus Pristimantibacillus lignocellulolyticus TaxID=2994561 RepID=A0A9J6ZCC4_9BACL|nr:MAG: hypothetical protein NAG76_18275 [Candidatus Pristimantibacillus lignocellulolyticus]